jgi:hypothetical protein
VLEGSDISTSFHRPRSATVIASAWIVIAVAGVLSGVEDYLNARKLAAVRPDLSEDPNANAIVDRFANLLGGTRLYLALACLFAVVIIVGAIGLLKLKPWGRRTIIAVTWLALFGVPIGQPLLLWEFTDLATLGMSGVGFFEIMIWVMGLVQLVIGIVIFGLMLRSLHGSRIRDAIRA